ncbi:MAG: T9SS type A sorting domain-containing protein, partial [Chlorobi bacterium]|nr:T9SS type A sorting domain-containing protein [Chlorobiota bacterium]
SYNIDDINNENEIIETDLPNHGHYVELDRNPEAGYFYYPVTRPYIDPYKNKIYLPNGGHSNISVVDFEANEALTLKNGSNWLSIPRHYHEGGGNLQSSTPTSTVFDEENIESGYDVLNLDYNYIDEASRINYPVFANRDLDKNWTYTVNLGDMDETVSTRGYILNLSPDDENILYMQGIVEDPATKIDLYCGEENWVGYFIDQEQDVFDALADELPNLNVIKHRDYTCAVWHPWAACQNTKSARGEEPHIWLCNGRHNVKYGDMLMLTPLNDNLISAGGGMQWNWQGNAANSSARPEVEYYDPQEQPTYTTLLIELDSTDNPQEIGAFVNDACAGACSVLPSDTVVVMQAYLNGQPEDSITFSEHYASREINEVKINKYSVLNLDNMLMEKRSYQIGEGAPAVYVSFKQKTDNNSFVDKDKIGFDIYPNPASGRVNFSLFSQKKGSLSVYVYSIDGKMIANPIRQQIAPGLLESAIKLLDSSGNKLKPGLYLIRADIGDGTEIRKLSVK